MEAGLPLKSGTLELLDGLAAADCPMAIVTSSSRSSAERNLSLAGIRSRFDTILTLDDLTLIRVVREHATKLPGRAVIIAVKDVRT